MHPSIPASLLIIASCSFLLDVPHELPKDRTLWTCAETHTCCEGMRALPVADGVASVGSLLLGLAIDCHGPSCTNGLEGIEIGAFVLSTATFVSALYGIATIGRCERLQQTAQPASR